MPPPKFVAFRGKNGGVEPRFGLKSCPNGGLPLAAEMLSDRLLDVRVGGAREYLPFRIHLLERIPTMEALAFLFPLPTLHALKMAYSNPELIYYPEAEGRPTYRAKELMIFRNRDGLLPGEYGDFVRCLKDATIGDNRIILHSPKPESWIGLCAKQHGKVSNRIQQPRNMSSILRHKFSEIRL